MMARYRIFFILLAITVLSYLSVDIFYKIVNAKLTEVKTKDALNAETTERKVFRKPPLDSYRIISERNLFGSTDKESSEIKINVDELEPTKLKLVLLGTVCSNSNLDFAVIEDTDKRKQELCRAGDTVASAEVIKILPGKVILRVDDRDEILSIKKRSAGEKTGKKPAASPKRPIMVSKSDVENAFNNMSEMLTQVRIRPYFSAGKPDGFMVSRIKQGSIFQKMGLKNGDVIQGVNDSPIGSADDMLELYKGLQSGSEITLNLKRRGKQETLKYTFK
jgi:general secretion pathway protein C